MRHQWLATMMFVALTGLACDSGSGPDGSRSLTAPSPAPMPPPPPPPVVPSFPSITIGEVVRFQFTADNRTCAGCRSYNVTPPSDGRLEVAVSPVSGNAGFLGTFEMYLVPGADSWDVGPGVRISVTADVRAGGPYEIRMYYPVPLPSEELELRASLK